MDRLSMVLVVATLLLVPLSAFSANAEHVKDQAMVNIEAYKYFKIEIEKGQKIRIDARVEALSYPVSVFLVKGQSEFETFVETDAVNVDDIKGGNISDFNDTFTVIKTFSEMNILFFDRSITIGEADTYYLVIMLYRDSTMDPEEVLTSRATLVNYDIEWSSVEKDIPYVLIPVVLIFLVLGIGLIAYYFWPRKEPEPEDRPPARRMVRTPPSPPQMKGKARSRF